MATIIFFGSLGDHISPSTQTYEVGAEPKSAADIFDDFAHTYADLAEARAAQPINVALNQKMADWNALVSEDDELAYLPPVTGG